MTVNEDDNATNVSNRDTNQLEAKKTPQESEVAKMLHCHIDAMTKAINAQLNHIYSLSSPKSPSEYDMHKRTTSCKRLLLQFVDITDDD